MGRYDPFRFAPARRFPAQPPAPARHLQPDEQILLRKAITCVLAHIGNHAIAVSPRLRLPLDTVEAGVACSGLKPSASS